MAINPLDLYSPMRFGGLASGIDTETIIDNLMRIEQLKVDQLMRDRQLVEWKRDDYRNVYDVLKTFKDSRFDVLNTSTYMLSSTTYKTYTVQSSNSDLISVLDTGSTTLNNISFDYVKSLATSAYITSDGKVSGSLSTNLDLTEGLDLTDKTVMVNLDGVTRTITFDQEFSDIQSLKDEFQGLLDKAFGAGRVLVSESDGQLTLSSDNSIIKLTGGSALSDLGLARDSSNRINLDSTLENISLGSPLEFDEEGNISFKINGQQFTFNKSKTMSQVMNEINNSDAGVKLRYSSLDDKFTLTANQTGSGETINIENISGNMFGEESVLGITKLIGNNGTNAVFSYNDTEVVRNTNTFTLDGVQYTLKKEFNAVDGPVTISSEYDIDRVYDNIKGFVDEYNKTIDQIHKMLSQERFRNFPPLTEEQKKEMSDKEVELWEEKARSGLLRNDELLEGIVSKMRRALIDKVEGLDINLFSIGITTGNYLDKGKLKVDETKLKEAIRTNGQDVEKLLAGNSEIRYSPSLSGEQRSQRYNESGLMHRISDILNDYIRTTRDNDGKKGMLLEKAGIVGDITEFKNTLNEEIDRINKRIDNANRILAAKEEAYWKKFTAMEKAISQMNSQSMWLMQQTMGGSY